MSRIGKQPIIIPEKVTVEKTGDKVVVKGPKGELDMLWPKKVSIDIKDSEIVLDIKDKENGEQKAFWGTARSLLQNLVTGVSEGFEKKLEINGVGYKAATQGKKLILNVGYSHPVEFTPPEGIDISVEKNVITVVGHDKQKVGQVAAQIRSVRKPEPYKGKGIKYIDENIKRKAGKMAKGGEK